MEENNCYYVSSKGIMKSCDIYSSNTKVSSIDKLIGYDLSKLKNFYKILIFFNQYNLSFVK